MKIPPANPLPARPTPETNKAAARRGATHAATPGDDDTAEVTESNNTPAAERDFASVLEEVSRPDARQDDAGEGDRRDARQSERTEREGEARLREEHEGGDSNSSRGGDSKGGGFEARASLREATVVGEATGARAILHIADLERIVSAVRAQVVAGARQEVTIELRRSVLEGLRVKLSADGGGRVTAEFIAASERVRSQLDARSAELAELLRGRGVNLASLRTSVETGDNSTGAHGQSGGDSAQSVRGAVSASQSEATAAAEPSAETGEDGGAATTYRA